MLMDKSVGTNNVFAYGMPDICFKGMLLCIGASLEKHFSFKIKNVIIYFGRVFVQLF